MTQKRGGRWLLIHPPVVRNCEPPPGLARIAGFLASVGIEYRVLDLNAEGFNFLVRQAKPEDAPASGFRSALKNRDRTLGELKSPDGYRNLARYNRSVSDLGQLLKAAGDSFGVRISPTDYQDPGLSPLCRDDLLAAAHAPERSPYHPFVLQRFAETAIDFPFDTVALSVGFLSQALSGFAILGLLRRHYPLARIVLGGSLVTSWIRNKLLAPDETFEGLVDRLVAGRFEDDPGRPAEPEDTPEPDFSRFPLSEYLAPGPILPVNLSWGCPWKQCSFCPERSENNPYIPLPLQKSVVQAGNLVRRYSPALLHLTDSEISPAVLKALTETPSGAPWYGFARFSPELEKREFTDRLAASGCVMLQLGLESGSQRVLDALGKGTELKQNSRILKNLHRSGIGVFLYVLLGTPAETEQEAFMTRDYVADHAEFLTGLNTAVFNMPRFGTEAGYFGSGEFYGGDLSLYCAFRHPAGWDRGRVRRFLQTEWNNHPAIRKIIGRTPPVYTSSHAPLFSPADYSSGPGIGLSNSVLRSPDETPSFRNLQL